MLKINKMKIILLKFIKFLITLKNIKELNLT